MPPAGEPYRVAKTRNAQPFRDGHRVILRSPDTIPRNFLLEAEPLRAGGAIALPVQSRVIGEDLYTRTDDEHHKEQIEEVLQAQPPGKARVNRGSGRRSARILRDKFLYRRDRA